MIIRHANLRMFVSAKVDGSYVVILFVVCYIILLEFARYKVMHVYSCIQKKPAGLIP